MTGFNSVSDALQILVEPFEVTPRWDAVVADAGVVQRRRTTSWRTFAIAAVFAAALLAAAAYAAGFGNKFSSWLTGSPGTPAPAAEQQGFAQRNQVAFASFPAGTKLRLLLRKSVAGTSFDLLGFRNGDAYCLRLVRTKLPQAIGRNECLRAEELRGHSALVANNVWFSVGRPAQSITGVYGFAADDVAALRVTRARGEERVPVKNNVFLSLTSQPSGTVQHHPLPNPGAHRGGCVGERAGAGCPLRCRRRGDHQGRPAADGAELLRRARRHGHRRAGARHRPDPASDDRLAEPP
jgi:hypothetical protein